MAFTLEPISLGIGASIVFVVWLLITLIFRKKPKEKKQTNLPTLKSYVKEAHNHMVESANNLIKLYEVFNDIDNGNKN